MVQPLWLCLLIQMKTAVMSVSDEIFFDFAISSKLGTISSSIVTMCFFVLMLMSKSASGICSQYSPISLASKNPTSSSRDSNFGSDLDLFLAILLSLLIRHISGAQYQCLFRFLI